MDKTFFNQISELTRPVGGQYPRPWMTDLEDPTHARIFIVGCSPATPYPENRLTHERHVNALFNLKGENCRRLYNEIRNKPSGTRENIDELTRMLSNRGCREILETNAVCYSVPESAKLTKPEHREGRDRGILIFRTIFSCIRPKVLIVSGGKSSTLKYLKSSLGIELEPCGQKIDHVPCTFRYAQSLNGEKIHSLIITIRSLGSPEWNKWQRWADDHFRKIVRMVVEELKPNS